jgi:hypothetical protein
MPLSLCAWHVAARRDGREGARGRCACLDDGVVFIHRCAPIQELRTAVGAESGIEGFDPALLVLDDPGRQAPTVSTGSGTPKWSVACSGA